MVVPNVEYAYTASTGAMPDKEGVSPLENKILPPCSPDTLAAPSVMPSVALAGAEPNLNVAGAVPETPKIRSLRFGFIPIRKVGVAGASVKL
jgi:hypothetical protein